LAQDDIMIVDDTPANLKLLEDMLLQEGHQVRSFPRGRLALAAALKNPPDLILLDVMMPEMNGYETCDQLKSFAGLEDVPVIFLSALSETEDKVKAFRSGGVDYISKPFQIEEVHARVKTHLKLHELQQTLKLHNEHLEETVAVRTRELVEANRRLGILDRSKDDFLNLISHEFRTPLNGLLGVGDIILGDMPPTPENTELQGLFQRSRRRILALLDDALTLAQIDVNAEQFRTAPVSLHVALTRAIARTAEFAGSRNVTLAPFRQSLSVVLGSEDLLVRALEALLETAVKFTEAGRTVRLSSDATTVSSRVIVESEGRIIPDSALPKFFNLLSIGEAIVPGGDLGLAPPMAHRILSLFGASCSVMNLEPPGIRFTIVLKNTPSAEPPALPHQSISAPAALTGAL
jgi:two-component system, sensor histidine kinase and response regulator